MKKTIIVSIISLMFISVLAQENINSHEYVDLGLPSGTKWAICNIGANKPEEYGGYYAWGETKTKTEYTRENSLTYGKQMSDISGNSKYDVATVNWGNNWRMPTLNDFNELIDNCEWYWIERNGVKGYSATSKINGNSIFFPAAGYHAESSFLFEGDLGAYRTSTPNDNDYDFGAYSFNFTNSGGIVNEIFIRGAGLSIRPVSNQNK